MVGPLSLVISASCGSARAVDQARWGEERLRVYCGIDWAERHHDVALVDETGTVIAQRRITETVTGYQELQEMFAAAGDGPQEMIPVAIETSHGLLVAALRASGRQVFAINPLS